VSVLSPAVSLHREAVTPRPEWLAAIAGGLAGAPDLWRRRVHHDPDQRTASLLLGTPAYDVWLLGWAPGQGIPLHDHGGSAGAITVVEGRLVEVFADDADDAAGKELGSRVLEPGRDVVTFGRRHRHGVSNLHDVPATSIHVYSPPLALMTYYDGDGGAATSWVR
jgi:predicted metal-dependent enzyme (double-stranded beta helix superfamily)